MLIRVIAYRPLSDPLTRVALILFVVGWIAMILIALVDTLTGLEVGFGWYYLAGLVIAGGMRLFYVRGS